MPPIVGMDRGQIKQNPEDASRRRQWHNGEGDSMKERDPLISP